MLQQILGLARQDMMSFIVTMMVPIIEVEG